MDDSSAKFKSAQSDFHKAFYQKFVNQTDTQDGSIYFMHQPTGTQVGLLTTGVDARTVEYKNGTVRAYNPKIKCFDTVHSAGIETYLTLGFGGSGKDLAKAWDITDLGPETMAGVSVEKLDMVPKDAAVKRDVAKFTIWVDLARDVSLKQVLIAPNKDTQTAMYTNIKVNEKVNTKPFEFGGKPCGAK